VRVHHVQVACPPGGEDAARRFYADGAGFEVDWSERSTFAGFERFHTADGNGNRVEVMAPTRPGR